MCDVGRFRICVVDNCVLTLCVVKEFLYSVWKEDVQILTHLGTEEFDVDILGECCILITDETLEGISGTDIILKFNMKHNKSIPTVLMSAIPPRCLIEIIHRKGLNESNPEIEILHKPFTVCKLKEALHTLSIRLTDQKLINIIRPTTIHNTEVYVPSAVDRLLASLKAIFTSCC